MRSIAVAYNPPPDVTTQHPQPPSLQEFWWNEQQVPGAQASWEKAFSGIPGYTLYTARRPGKGRSDGLGVLVKSTLVCEYAERIDLPMETGTLLPLHPSPPPSNKPLTQITDLPTPHIISPGTRIGQCLCVRDKAGRRIMVGNVHLPFPTTAACRELQSCHLESVMEAVEARAAQKGAPLAIVAGDFNCEGSAPACRLAEGRVSYKPSLLPPHPPPTSPPRHLVSFPRSATSLRTSPPHHPHRPAFLPELQGWTSSMAAVANQALASGMGGVVCAGVTHKNHLGQAEAVVNTTRDARPTTTY